MNKHAPIPPRSRKFDHPKRRRRMSYTRRDMTRRPVVAARSRSSTREVLRLLADIRRMLRKLLRRTR